VTGAAYAPQPTRAKIRGVFERSAKTAGEKKMAIKKNTGGTAAIGAVFPD
jgi:hypothetical protein